MKCFSFQYSQPQFHLGLHLQVSYQNSYKYNIKNTPGLIINEKKISEGKVLNDREILRMIKVLS